MTAGATLRGNALTIALKWAGRLVAAVEGSASVPAAQNLQASLDAVQAGLADGTIPPEQAARDVADVRDTLATLAMADAVEARAAHVALAKDALNDVLSLAVDALAVAV